MKKFAELLKTILGKGVIAATEKAELQKLFNEMDVEAKETFEADYNKAIALDAGDEGTDDEVTAQLKALLGNVEVKLRDEVVATVNAWLKQQEEVLAKKVGFGNSEVRKSREMVASKMKALCEALISGDETKLKEMTTDASGSPFAGYVVDSELAAEIRVLTTEYGVARREFLSLQLSKNTYRANNLVTDVTVNWEDEAGEINSTQAVLGQETLELKKLAAIVTLTSELIEDQETDLFAFLISRVAEEIARKEDLAFFNGDGTSTYGSFTGLLQAANTNEVVMTGTTFASMDGDDLIDMVDETPVGALMNAKYFMHRSIMSIVRKLKASTTGEYVYQRPSESGPATIWGYPVVLVEVMPKRSETAADTAFVIFGDLKKACILGYKGAMRAKRFDAGVVKNVANNGDINLITTDREAIRVTQRSGYILILPKAVTVLKTAEVSA